MEALIISVNEPQLDRCLVSVMNQSVSFSNVVHVNCVVPEYVAFNQGMKKTTDEWAMKIDGDFILYQDAVEKTGEYIKNTVAENVCGYFFGLYDTFLEYKIGFCSVLRTKVYKEFQYQDKLSNDRMASRVLRKKGWQIIKNMSLVTGTHFDQPDEFQVFKRFYTQKLKYPYDTFVQMRLTDLFEKTSDALYDVGLKAGEFALKRKGYPGSHNLVFDMQLYKEFKEEHEIRRSSSV